MKKQILTIFFLSISIMLNSCVNNTENNLEDGDFFPLKVGQQWTYKITESDMDTSRIRSFPKEFTISVIGDVTLADQKYFLVTNYFIPGPNLPDTILLRNSDNQVLMRFGPEEEEYLFYSFSASDSVWRVPMYNPTTLNEWEAKLVRSNGIAAISWNLDGYPDDPPYGPPGGRIESGWGETFKRGIGKTEIVSVSQVYGKIVWELIDH